MISDYEDVTGYTLDPGSEEELLHTQIECTFIWSNKEGWPVGVIMNYVFRDGRFWLTAAKQRKRIAAVRRDPRVSVVITSKGSAVKGSKTVTYKGRCTVHEGDDALKSWFYPALAAAVRPHDAAEANRFASFLDSPHRVILEVVPEGRIGFDGTKMSIATAESAAHLD
jgi:hypothetical protein